ncbi:hypothetical protein IWQ62_005098 [Dispira parvispora]|uniref:Peptidase S1 domain-containing protein n=1 Tax=Dispira parvispora TaxID=1520584 RepID=A0A9W8AR26_9FUNG|nr:hypothetical protein IWQ62_005098 [Dispira parvispora]
MARQWSILGYACVALCVVSTYAQPSTLHPRILGGENAMEGQVAFFGSMFNKNQKRHYCAGSLIGQEWLLTAANCVSQYSNGMLEAKMDAPIPAEALGLSLGSVSTTPSVIFDAKEIFIHQQFNASGRIENDIAVVRLAHKVTLSEKIGIAKIYSGNLKENDELQAAGMGVVNWANSKPADTLQIVTLRVSETDRCRAAYDGYKDPNGPQVCTKVENGRDACQGDSGGPLYKAGSDKSQLALVGIISYGGSPNPNNPACGSPDGIQFHTHVFNYLDWISEKTGIPKGQFLDSAPENVTAVAPGNSKCTV